MHTILGATQIQRAPNFQMYPFEFEPNCGVYPNFKWTQERDAQFSVQHPPVGGNCELWETPKGSPDNRAPFLGLPIKGHPIIRDPAFVYLRGSLLLFPRIDVIFDLEHFPRGVHVGPTAGCFIILLLSLDCLIALFAVNCLCFAFFAFLRSSDNHTALVSSSLLLLLPACLLF